MKHAVYVWVQPEEIEVYQQSDDGWIAEGLHAGTLIKCNGSSKMKAIRLWTKAARAQDESVAGGLGSAARVG